MQKMIVNWDDHHIVWMEKPSINESNEKNKSIPVVWSRYVRMSPAKLQKLTYNNRP